MPFPAPDRRIRVFVHLAHGFGASRWQARWDKGEIIGLNERLPYGYFWAEKDGCTIEYSEAKDEGYFGKALRLGLRVLLGFDFLHAWHNRRGIASADAVWTHNESQHLAVLLLLRVQANARRPKIIAQSVWLFDHWSALARPRRWFYAKLMAQADVLTVHSPENLKLARELFPACRSEMIAFGVRAGPMIARERRATHRPIRVLSLGNDRHRDWATLIAAVKGWEHCTLRLVSPRIKAALLRGADNAVLAIPTTNHELAALYDWADIVVLALTPNLHASGITVVLEATVFGVPVICTDTGGLRAYFSDVEVRYVPAQQPAAIRREIAALADDDDERSAMVERARARMVAAGLTSRRFAQRHAELSRELLGISMDTAAEEPAATSGDFGQRRRTADGAAHVALWEVLVLLGVAAAAALALSGMVPIAGQTAGDAIDLCAFRPTFTEDFDKLSVSALGENGSRWIAHTPWHGDFGDASFVDPRPGFPFRVQDGILQIEARKTPDGIWQSDLLASATPTTSGLSQRYGYFEARVQLPPGPGVWPAFWLNANQRSGAKNPGVEIDVLEYYSQFPNSYHSTIHIWDTDPAESRVEDHVTAWPAGSLSNGFHTYGVDVEPDWITFYLDRHQIWRTATPLELQDPLMVLVNLALGGGWSIDRTPNAPIMKIDYVHVYERNRNGPERSCSPPRDGNTASREATQ